MTADATVQMRRADASQRQALPAGLPGAPGLGLYALTGANPARAGRE